MSIRVFHQRTYLAKLIITVPQGSIVGKESFFIFSTEALSNIMKTTQKGVNFPVGPNLSPTYSLTNLHVVLSKKKKQTLPSGSRAFAKEI